MKKILNNKKVMISFIIFNILCISLIVFLISRNNNNNINTKRINKALISSKNAILKEKKILKKENKPKNKLYKNYIYEVMDCMIKIHKINDNIKSIKIEKIEDKNFKQYKTKIGNQEKKIKNLKNKYFTKLRDSDDSIKKLINKIDIKKCLKYITNMNKSLDGISSISSFLNTNKDYWKKEDNKLVFLKRKVYNEYKEIDKKNRFKYRLIDDQEAPIIKAENITINVGEKLDLKTQISCYDEVDDEVECSINGDYDINKEGNYSLKIEAKDQANNIGSKEIILNVVAKKKINVSNKNPYYTEVIRNQNVVIVYGLDENQEYTKIVKVFICSVGLNNNTPTGTFTTSDKYVWRPLYGGVYGQYATRIVNSILFHSVPYYSQDKGNIESEEFNKLGNAASMGCVRMTVSDVKWIYDNCPKGMTVKIYDGDLPKGVSKPNAPKIDLNSPNKGWDPTDPDINNPWK